MDNCKVRFRWKDYRDGNRQKTMTLDGGEFIRRFLMHVLPDGFHRIRYFGFLGNCHRARKLERCRELLGMTPPPLCQTSCRLHRIWPMGALDEGTWLDTVNTSKSG
jgi:hypothetical protein